ncbi:hypothetical protein [Saccharothrix deserti]|uniref:hypothetical protein n=1 Tax=Saccharothrix deserti TaxID=2593674 RepID=UPI00131D18AE|nr:hypothetical protein [Saccharothrix deserti]
MTDLSTRMITIFTALVLVLAATAACQDPDSSTAVTTTRQDVPSVTLMVPGRPSDRVTDMAAIELAEEPHRHGHERHQGREGGEPVLVLDHAGAARVRQVVAGLGGVGVVLGAVCLQPRCAEAQTRKVLAHDHSHGFDGSDLVSAVRLPLGGYPNAGTPAMLNG